MRRAASKRVEPSCTATRRGQRRRVQRHIRYALPLTSCAAKTAQEAIALKQLQAEKEFGAINWDIDKEESSVIDGSQVTKYEYSFEKEIDHVTKKYEYKTIYVFNSSMCYEISVYATPPPSTTS